MLYSDKTDGAKGSLMYALMSMNYYDDASIDMLCKQLTEGNYECMHKAFHMLTDISDKLDPETKNRIITYLERSGEILGERLDLLEELYDYYSEAQ